MSAAATAARAVDAYLGPVERGEAPKPGAAQAARLAIREAVRAGASPAQINAARTTNR
ncbi:hypothetical protein [Streptomyces noursei]|uniref:hypothetical protein n=1 Tax=Streptomyces noursei TaxID=1971 RepID=UPI001671C1E6|nr:hypothetical protein [Streptomyces noursei]MCZ1013975.1 hypothetical protein [Streptomyces noursei]GGX40466.1 hypothetical protein GCM10010341_72980 [Streptomyces noursei]